MRDRSSDVNSRADVGELWSVGEPLAPAGPRAEDPAVVVTFGPDGIFGHPDHIAIGAATDEAFARLRSEGSSGFQRLAHGAVPQSVFERWNRQRAELRLHTFDPKQTYHMRGIPAIPA